MTQLTGKSFLNGQWVETKLNTFQATNPQDNQLLPTHFFEADETTVQRAALSAQKAFQDYKQLTGKQRAQFLKAIGNHLRSLSGAIIEQAMLETALPQQRLSGELARTTNQLALFAQLIETGDWLKPSIDLADPKRQPVPKPDVRLTRVPLGPVAIFGASNFPLAFSVAGGDTASALAAGCPVIIKGHPLHPGTSELVAQAIDQAAQQTGMPTGVFSLLQGSSHQLSHALVKNPAIQAVGFTGSLGAGRALYNVAVNRPQPIPFYGEMGSSNPVFILPNALHAQTAKEFITSLVLGAGQFCTNPGLVFILDDDKYTPFTDALNQQVSIQPAQAMLSGNIHHHYQHDCDKRKSMSSLQTLAVGKPGDSSLNQAQVHLFSTTATAFLENPLLENEVFGPAALIVKCQNIEEMYTIAENLTGHLTATIIEQGDEPTQVKLLLSILQQQVGRIIINGYPTGVEICDSMQHGGPYPAATDNRSTSVGTEAINRFVRPICFQNTSDELLPAELQNANPLNSLRLINGEYSRKAIS